MPPGRGVFNRGPSLRRSLWRPLPRPSTDLALRPNPLRFGPLDPPPPPPRQRRRFHWIRTPSIDELSLPQHVSSFRLRRVGSRGACHRSRCSRARGSRHCDPASGAASPAEPPRGRARGLDPCLSTWTKRRSSTSATQTTREHDHVIAQSRRVRPLHPESKLSGRGAASDPTPRACACALRSPRELSLPGSCHGAVAFASLLSTSRRLPLARSLS